METHLSGLVHGFLRVRFHFVVGVIRDLCDGLLEDGGCLPDRQRCVQVRFALKANNIIGLWAM